MPVVSHGLAWTGHFFVEKNAPATFRYPLQGFLANLHMYRLRWAGRGSGAGATESMVIVPRRSCPGRSDDLALGEPGDLVGPQAQKLFEHLARVLAEGGRRITVGRRG